MNGIARLGLGIDIVTFLFPLLFPPCAPVAAGCRGHCCCVARGIPFTPPVKFVLMALQQLLFFYRSEQVLLQFWHTCSIIRFGAHR